MSDAVWIALIVAVAVVIVLFMFRRQLSSFGLKANKEGFEAQLETHEPSSATPGRQARVNISGNRQVGARNVIDVGRDDANVEKNVQFGEDQKIIARSDPMTGEKKEEE